MMRAVAMMQLGWPYSSGSARERRRAVAILAAGAVFCIGVASLQIATGDFLHWPWRAASSPASGVVSFQCSGSCWQPSSSSVLFLHSEADPWDEWFHADYSHTMQEDWNYWNHFWVLGNHVYRTRDLMGRRL